MLSRPRWSKKTDELVRHVASRCRPSYQSELGKWLEERPRFRDLIAANQDKIRKKLTVSDEEDTRLDVRAELLVAYLVLSDRRFDVALEAYGAQRLGPDLSVTYRVNQRFNLEVTRSRTGQVANIIGAKLRQLPVGVANAIVIVDVAVTEDGLTAALQHVKERGKQADALKLAGVFAMAHSTLVFCANREARHPLAREIVSALSACFSEA